MDFEEYKKQIVFLWLLRLSNQVNEGVESMVKLDENTSDPLIDVSCSLDSIFNNPKTKKMVMESKRAKSYLQDYVACLKKVSELSKELMIGD